jgi:hypothetical protein
VLSLTSPYFLSRFKRLTYNVFKSSPYSSTSYGVRDCLFRTNDMKYFEINLNVADVILKFILMLGSQIFSFIQQCI